MATSTDLAVENPEIPWWGLALAGLAVGIGSAALISAFSRKRETVSERPPVPYGKGIYVYDLDHGGSPENLANTLKWLGMDWVLLQTHRIEDGQLKYTDTAAKRNAYIAAIRSAGIRVWFWGWPRPELAPQFANVAADLIRTHNPVGFVVNAEKGWDREHGQIALSMMGIIRGALGNTRGLGLTSFGGASAAVPNFPWVEFARYCDFGSPQIYDRNNNLGANYPAKSMERWSKLFRVVSPVWTAGPSKTPAMMDDIQNRTPLQYPSASWWEYSAAVASPGRAEAIRSYSLAPYAAVA